MISEQKMVRLFCHHPCGYDSQMIKILPLQLLKKKKKKIVAGPLLHPFSEIYL